MRGQRSYPLRFWLCVVAAGCLVEAGVAAVDSAAAAAAAVVVGVIVGAEAESGGGGEDENENAPVATTAGLDKDCRMLPKPRTVISPGQH